MALFKLILRTLFRLLFRVEVHGLEHFQQAGKRVLVVANHTSFLDAALLMLFLPGGLTFAVNTEIAKRRLFRPFLALTTIFTMDPTNPLSTKSLIKYLKGDKKAVIFPEGRITVTGSLMKIYDGTGLIADKSNAAVLPVRIDGAQYTPFSRLKGQVRRRWFPKITLTVLPSRKLEPPADCRGRARRKYAGKLLTDLMTEMVFDTSDIDRNLFDAVIDARNLNGGNHVVADDIRRQPFTYNRLITGAFLLGPHLTADTAPNERIGVMLPNATGTVVSFLALHAEGRTPAMLNFTAGAAGIRSACETARIRRVITSRRFIETAKLQQMVTDLAGDVDLIYLEDLAGTIAASEKLRAWLAGRFPRAALRLRRGYVRPDAPAVVLFTSGSEGAPKGVVLSHRNLLANREQLAARVDFSAQDVILNALPMFHSFGLTAGTLLPLLSGMKTFFYPSPLHYRIVPEMAYDVNATVLFGTNTFLAGYARFAHPYDFYSVRYVFAGAEKLADETRRVWMDKFGIRIFEGYGATETSPVLAANTPMDYRPGSVGRFLPGIEYHLEPVPGVIGGRLSVRGPNIMHGYLLADRPGVLVPPSTELGRDWYDTGDIVEVDDDGFVFIRGRAKRFAKIGGEMVSLAAVEELAAQVWPDALHAVVSLPDRQKGEQLILLSESKEADRSSLQSHARQVGISEINIPKKILNGIKLPLLGTGKIDYSGVKAMAADALGVEVAQ